MARMTAAERFETRYNRAAERAIADGLQFRRAEDGVTFQVVSPNNTYTVKLTSFAKLEGTCECEGFKGGHLCKHVVGVLMLVGLVDRNGNRVA